VRPSAHSLAGTWPLDGLPEGIRAELVDGAPAISLEPGQTLYRLGDSATSFFVVLEGEVELHAKGRTEAKPHATRVSAGAVLGAEALLADRDHLEEARAKSSAIVAEIGRGRFERARRDPGARDVLARAQEIALRRRAASVLEGSTLGGALTADERRRIADACEWTTRRRGEVLYAAGDRSDAAVLVAEGVVRLVRTAPGGDRTVAYLQAGDVVGADEVVSGVPRALAAIADTPVEAFRIPASVLTDVVRQNPGALGVASRAASMRQDEIRAAAEKAGSAASVFAESYRLQVAGAMLVIDPELCVRCGICSWSCDQTHGASRLVRRGDKMLLPTEGAGSELRPLLLPNSCQHCTNPECMKDCPTAAIAKGADGEVYIREELCTGCGSCARDCPWNNIQLAPRKDHPIYDALAVKCDLCVGYGVSACVHNCPVGAIFRVTPSDDVDFLRVLAPSLGGSRPRARQSGRPGLGAAIAAWLLPLVLVALPALGVAAMLPGARRGIGTGIAAAATMLLLALYGVRKRAIKLVMRLWKGALGRAGGGAGLTGSADLRLWLPAHVVLGGALFGWTFAHTGLSLGGPVTAVLQISLLLAVVTGAWGYLLYGAVPKRLSKLEDRSRLPEDYEQEIAAARSNIDRMRGRLSPAEGEILRRAEGGGGLLSLVRGGRKPAEDAEHLWQALSVEERRVAGAAGRRAVEEVAKLRTLRASLRLTRMVRSWLPLHLASMALAFAALALHVVLVIG